MTELDLHPRVRAQEEELISDRRSLHRHPELSNQETGTAKFIFDRLQQIGLSPRLLLDGTAVVADLRGALPGGHALLLRADIDALPIQERGGNRTCRSERPGVMHACGHDAHIAIALGAARLLADLRPHFAGLVRLVFQPAEETAGGAAPLIALGVMEGPTIEGALGLHIWSGLPVGVVGVRAGAIFASADEFAVVIRGRGGHGALPHQAIDPVPVASLFVIALQTLVSRETSPFQSAVVTVGKIEGGQAFNVIPETVTLVGTVRAFTTDDRERLLRRIGEVAAGLTSAFGATAEVTLGAGCPPVICDPQMAELVRGAVRATSGAEVVSPDPLTIGDDVSVFMNMVPGCYFLLGAGNQAAGITAPHHHPEFDLDESSLTLGLEVMVRASLEFCHQGPGRS